MIREIRAIRVRSTATVPGDAELRAWLAAHAPLPYEETQPDRFDELGTHQFRARITLFEGCVHFLEPHDARAAVVATSAGLLTGLIGGALGPFTWDVIEEDWCSYIASGEDAASLAFHARVGFTELTRTRRGWTRASGGHAGARLKSGTGLR